MSAGTGNGLGTAVELLGGFGDLSVGGEGEQQQLFADADDAPGPLPAPPASGAKGGRPRGARNRSTEEWRQFFLGKHQAPVMVLGGIYSRSVEELARALHLTRVVAALAPGQTAIEEVWETIRVGDGTVDRRAGYLVWDLERAFDKQMAAVNAALPYINQKQPLALDVRPVTRGVVVLGSLDVDDQAAEDGLALPLAGVSPAADQPQRNQQVIDVTPEKSHAEQSHDAPNPLEYRDE